MGYKYWLVSFYASILTGADFIISEGTIDIPPGETTIDIVLAIVDDGLIEDSDGFTIKLISTLNDFNENMLLPVTILDNDGT